MNTARASDEAGFLIQIIYTLTDSSLAERAETINNNLIKFDKDIYHQWIILDYSSTSVIRKIYLSNFGQEFKDSFTVKGIGYYLESLFNFVSSDLSLGKRNENSGNGVNCLQYELVYNEYGTKYYAITNDSKFINSSKSQLYIKKNGNHYNVVSSYDSEKCLVFLENNKLSAYPCNKSDEKINKSFVVINGKLCSSTNKSLCIENNFKLMPSILHAKEYMEATCSTKFLKQYYKCCFDCIKLEYTDEAGDWGFENGEWCGIPYECNNNLRGYFYSMSQPNYCLRVSNIDTGSLELDHSNYSLWDVPYTHNGHFDLKLDYKRCIMAKDNASLVLGEWDNDRTIFYRNSNYIMSPLYQDKCVGLNTDSSLIMINCNEYDPTQLFYFNLWITEEQ
ncbi:hypothetical protein H8356DRAFT_969059 [Neocallimastix lanati (nom. inval.)]|nr:hypothetical protein H8356DRAFT_969059 [Neocallimastix sp. JGI-2020a]